MMKKRLFSIFCALAVCLALLPGMTLSASAANDPCDGTHGDGWQELTAAGGTLSTGKYYLSGDVTATGRIDISGDVTLCLNGHVLNLNGNYIYVNGSGTSLTLCDCNSTNQSHRFTVGTDGLWTLAADDATGENIETVTGGVITGGKGNVIYGGCVCMDSGSTFNMHGGNIVGNSTTYGGGVYVKDASFNMSGGSINGNSATYGGGVEVNSGGTFNMSGDASISGNTAEHGGGVYVQSGTFTMSDGSISGNTAANGGGVCVYSSTFDMSGDASISGNAATIYGGGVLVQQKSSSFTMSGGSITGNSATYGGGVYAQGSTFTMSGGSITGNSATNGGGVLIYDANSQLKLRGAPEIDGDIRLNSKPIEITGALTDGTTFQLTNVTGTFTSGWSTYMSGKNPADYFTIDKTGYHAGLSSGEAAVLANTYTVTFNSNGGTGTMEPQDFTYDVQQPLSANQFTKTGHSFTGWSTTPDGSVVYADKQEVKTSPPKMAAPSPSMPNGRSIPTP